MKNLIKISLLGITASIGILSCIEQNSPTIPNPQSTSTPIPSESTKPTPLPQVTDRPTSSPTPVTTSTPSPVESKNPEASPTPKPKEYTTLSTYKASISDKSRIISSTNHSKSSTMSWFDDTKNAIFSVGVGEASETMPKSFQIATSAQRQSQISVFSASGDPDNTLLVTTSLFEPDITAPSNKTSTMVRVKDNQVLTHTNINYVLYDLAVNNQGNGFAIVSDEEQIDLSNPNAEEGTQTTVGRINISNWSINDTSTPKKILELPAFFQGSNIVRSVNINANGEGLIITSSSTNSATLKTHIIKAFSVNSTYDLNNKNLNENPQIILKDGKGHINWKNGKITLLENLMKGRELDFSTTSDFIFLDHNGDGFLLRTDKSIVEWQRLSNYAVNTKTSSLQFKEGSFINSISVNLTHKPTLLGLNYTCEKDFTCVGEALTNRKVWLKEIN
jgi:hypothetical protein